MRYGLCFGFIFVSLLGALTFCGCSEVASIPKLPKSKGNERAEGPPQPVAADAGEVANRISIENFTFRPPVLMVSAGTRVTWVNSDDVPHTATSTSKAFASPTLDTDDRFEFVFDEPGEFEYFCAVHRHMTGKVIVTK